MLPPYCVSIPRTDGKHSQPHFCRHLNERVHDASLPLSLRSVPLETILGFQLKKKGDAAVSSTRSASEEFPGPDHRDADDYPSPKDKDKDEGKYQRQLI